MTKAALTFLGMSTLRKKCLLGKIARTGRLLNLSTERTINDLKARPFVRSTIFFQMSTKEQTFSFFFNCKKGIYNFEETQKSILDITGDLFCPGTHCFNRQKCKILGAHVSSSRLNKACGKIGAWLLVHQVPFTLQEHVKTTKTNETRFLFA